uniref:Uncharacterized protein n=1 Tax=Romanomermis culicivorax TaxID=13658 RepID=A0A915K7S0_ROMCU
MYLAGHGMNGFKRSVETFCCRPGTSSGLMVMTFSATWDASVMIKGLVKSDCILLAFRVLVSKTRSLTAKLHKRAFPTEYASLMVAAFSSPGQAGQFDKVIVKHLLDMVADDGSVLHGGTVIVARYRFCDADVNADGQEAFTLDDVDDGSFDWEFGSNAGGGQWLVNHIGNGINRGWENGASYSLLAIWGNGDGCLSNKKDGFGELHDLQLQWWWLVWTRLSLPYRLLRSNFFLLADSIRCMVTKTYSFYFGDLFQNVVLLGSDE